MKVLVACEESQRVCIAFREKGHEAYSCDIQECSGGHPEWHICFNVLKVLSPIDNIISFDTMDGSRHIINGSWDLIIAHPPCTYLSGVGTRHFSLKCNSPDKVNKRLKLREEAFEFFMKIAGADCERIAIENPVGYVNTHWRKADQIIEPWHFAFGYDDTENYVTKRTCLWLKGIPPLCQTNMLMRPEPHRTYIAKNGKRKNVDWEMAITAKTQAERAKLRSKTFPGIARAMAEQWGKLKIGE